MNRFLSLIISFLFISGAVNAAKSSKKAQTDSIDNHYEALARNLDLFNILYKELDMFYVDTINAEETIQKGIDAMLSELDPYTVYIPEKDEEDFKFMLTGEYAGVGATIGKVKDTISFIEIYEGTPAYKNGIKAGDRLIEIDGKSTKNLTVSDVSENLRGENGTQVKILIEDAITHKQKKLTITREKITLPTIEYADTLKNGIGYIRFSSFTENSADFFKKAFLDLKEKKKATSLIVDLRNNPGGLLDQAVDIVNLFVDNQSTIVYTKSKVKQLDEIYKAKKKPIDRDIPIVVLVNENSASASEVFAGSLQDLDRAVIVGKTRTYGKGLVQTTRELPFGGKIKVTISKYYIPSGRCVQAINYAKRDENGRVQRIPDSLTTEFSTKNGRIVKDGGGIMPDIISPSTPNVPTIAYKLYTDNIIFNYANLYVATHSKIAQPKDFVFNEYEQFIEYVKKQNFTYKLKTEDALAKLKEITKEEGYAEVSKAEFDSLEAKLSHNLDKDLVHFQDIITRLISTEIMQQVYFQKGFIIESLKKDDDVETAIQTLQDKEKYNNIFKVETK